MENNRLNGKANNNKWPFDGGSRNRPRFTNMTRANEPKFLSLTKITDLLLKKPEEIILCLFNQGFNFDSYLNSNTMGDKLINQLIILLEKTLECSSLKIKLIQLLNKVADSKFFKEHVYEQINQRENLTSYNSNLIRSVLNICCQMVELVPATMIHITPMKERLELLIRFRLNNPDLIKQYEDKFTRLEQIAAAKLEYERKMKTFRNIDHSDLEPPNDIAELNIIPKLEDILTDQLPFLRKNITNSAYKNVDHYLDVQFRLLREDYLNPLRDGVTKFRSIIREARLSINQKAELTKEVKRKLKNIESLNVYFGIKLESQVITNEGIIYAMKLERDTSINWDSSKKLMFGSLVCFSSDFYMNNCLVGVIGQRDINNLKEGLIFVRFNFDFIEKNGHNLPQMNQTYTMIETTAYFESYKHVLEALVSFKNSNHDDFPFKEHLVYCLNSQIDQPKYLRNACIDFRTLVDHKKKIEINRRSGENGYLFSNETKYAEKCFLSNKNNWPTKDQMKVDGSQYDAIKLALENKLALIQGPPGTGKTFIGVKIVQLLLNNKHLWWNRPGEPHRPILMICYTNHALDQFLEYCINECGINSGVVRVGGRSKSANLDSFLLSNIKREMKHGRQIDPNIHHRIIEQKRALESTEDRLNNLNNLMKLVSTNGIITFESLASILTPVQADYFKKRNETIPSKTGRNCTDFNLLEWLGIFNINNFNLNDIYSMEKQLADLNLKEQEEEYATEENKNDQDDNESFNRERMLEDDFDQAGIKNYLASRKSNANAGRSHFDILIDEKDIFEMLIDHNSFYGSDKLEHFLLTHKFESEFKTVGKKGKKQTKPFNEFISNYLKMILNFESNNDQELENITNLDDLTYSQRFQLYREWLNEFINAKQQAAENLKDKFNLDANLLKELRLQEDLSIMKNAYIIAMTTTGSSRYHNILKDVGPRIVIVEEAAEVFEAHIVSSLSKHCEHLILIGDHVQLRPNPAVYKLAYQYNLDVSLFERLINNNIKQVMLNCQHRMRPEISILMKHFYTKSILNHESVYKFENIIGLTTNIFFLNHDKFENAADDSQTKLNRFESDYLAQFCHYFLKQQYTESQITVLTMYLGQMMEIRKALKNLKITSVKVSTVDNYQGEENDIILLSLVRSNKDKKIGFLKIDNRVCVALSRARKGFFCIGNLNMIASQSKTWSNVVDTAKENNCFGDSITLTCGSHKLNDIEASEASHFKKRPDGGCLLPCGFRLKCGHACALHCHTYDQEHKKYECKKTCDKPMNCSHYCKQTCGHSGACDKCFVRVDKIIKECSHPILFRCDTEPLKKHCMQPCANILNCGHQCLKKCFDSNCYPCETKINVKSTCKHESNIQIRCSDREKIWLYQQKCTKTCNELLKCGHICTNKCFECFGGYIHKGCEQKCGRLLYCGHECNIPCSKNCVPCQKKCQNKCVHSKCNSKCSDPCKPCLEKCSLKCEHKSCSKKCYEPCDIEPCNEPCNQKLKCGHLCIGLCGDPCPRLCRLCNKDQVNEIFFGTEDKENARFVYLKDCNHIVEVTGMQGWIQSRYEKNQDSDKSNSIQFPECPKCKTQIRNTLRYSYIIKKQLHLIETIKLKQYGDLEQNRRIQNELINEIRTYKPREHLKSSSKLEFIKKTLFILENSEFSHNDLASIRNTWNIFNKITQIESNVNLIVQTPDYSFQINFLNFEANKILDLIIDDFYRIIPNGNQKIIEINFETERIESILNYFILKNEAYSQSKELKAETKIATDQIFNTLELNLFKKIQSFNEIKQKVEDSFKELNKYIKRELTKVEKKMIVEAIGLSPGHWYMCPNGHTYCIGDCGGAMQESKCPECKCTIGGTQHRLTAGNRVATEMDGATQSAWPG